jgi:FAD:protein FMN transferase
VTGPADLPLLPGFSTTAPPPAEQPRRTWVEQVMGMPVSLQVRGPGARDDGADAAVRLGTDWLHRVDDLFSTWQPGSQVSRLQRGELTLAAADPLLREVAGLCERARERTDGWFDAQLPGPDGVRRFDPTGLVKGWAVQRCLEQLSAALPEHDVAVNAGGDIAMVCRRTDTPDWRVGIENPLDHTELVTTLQLRTGAAATSGTAARGSHIINPHTGLSTSRLASVSIIGPDLMWADVYATAAFARGPASVDWLRTLVDHAWLMVDLDGQVTSA